MGSDLVVGAGFSGATIARLLAESFTHYVSSNDDENEEGSNPLQEMLNSGEYEMTDIPEEEPEEEKTEPAE